MLVPVFGRWFAELVERVEEGELDVGVNPVDQPNAAVAEAEDHCVLVLDAVRSDDTA